MTDKNIKKEQNTCRPEDSKDVYEKTKQKDTATDVYYKTECKLEDSNVAIPTFDSVVEAKTWVDDENKR